MPQFMQPESQENGYSSCGSDISAWIFFHKINCHKKSLYCHWNAPKNHQLHVHVLQEILQSQRATVLLCIFMQLICLTFIVMSIVSNLQGLKEVHIKNCDIFFGRYRERTLMKQQRVSSDMNVLTVWIYLKSR